MGLSRVFEGRILSPADDQRIHQVDFCSQVASAANLIFQSDQGHPFREARVEGFGRGDLRLKRKDLRFCDAAGAVVLAGEVEFPGTPGARSPYDEKLVRNACEKADNAGARYFFTWNVNTFVLWDRERWDVPPLDRRVREWRLELDVGGPQDVARPAVLDHIKSEFLPRLLADLALICTGQRPDWGMAPDDIFIKSLESHLDWPVRLLGGWLEAEAESNRQFNSQLQEWMASQDWTFVRSIREEWRKAVDRAARTLCYILVNRLIFYEALRAKFPDLAKLRLPRSFEKPEKAYTYLQNRFDRAVRTSGDYEPLLYPHERDWACTLVFRAPGAIDAWGSVLRAIGTYDFSSVPSDVVGRIFQRLISPEERHRFGQHFTCDEVVDLINAFCIRGADFTVLDPACGSGSFLVRAYYLKKGLNPSKSHEELLSDLFGCDIALYPAHLATLNLAARQITDEANYPRIARRDFFTVRPDKEFCRIPGPQKGSELPVHLPALDAVVGNPPYVRQEKIAPESKEAIADLVRLAWPDTQLSGRSDLHCYFWLAAARLLNRDGYFGFLTSSSWLDVEYGFPLQEWVLRHFRVLAIMESADEPWFPDARVKTCATILKRCDDEADRSATLVKFVQFRRPLAEILGVHPGADDEARLQGAARLRERIEGATENVSDEEMRIIIKRQSELWDEGEKAGKVLGERFAGKWGRYLRAPDFYFDMLSEFGHELVPLGQVAAIRRGITSGCDDFFMPHDMAQAALAECPDETSFRRRFGVPRETVAACKLKIAKAGDGSVHPIESEYLAPEVHSLMEVMRPEVRTSEVNRMVLLVDKPLSRLGGTHVRRYLQYGEKHSFASAKSRPVPVPRRTTCAARHPWYDLTTLAKPGVALWSMSQQYRHIVAANPDRLVCNHNLFDINTPGLTKVESRVLVAVLNSTLLGLFKTFYGRYAGTEGNLKTEVVDVNLLDVPDPREVEDAVAERILSAFERMCKRPTGRLLEEDLMACHSPERARRIAEGPITLPEELRQPDRRQLDDAVFELLGVKDATRRAALVDQLYEETARHYRHIRVVEIQKMEQRSRTRPRRFGADELAADAWDALQLDDACPVIEWLSGQPNATKEVLLPEAGPSYLAPSNHMFDSKIVYFGKGRETHLDCETRAEAELVARLSSLGIRGPVALPATAPECVALLASLDSRLTEARRRFEELAASRTSDERLRRSVVELLVQWFTHGRMASPDSHP